jgi:hypothetical protein
MSEPQPYVIPESCRPQLERMGVLREEDGKFYVGRDWVMFEAPQTVDGFIDLIYEQSISEYVAKIPTAEPPA